MTKKQTKEFNRLAIEKIETIRFYEQDGHHQTGIGFYNGQLIEYRFSEDAPLAYEKITLPQSVDWMERMHYAEIRFGLTASQCGQGFINWLRSVQTALRILHN
jgi:hypothetical protein